MSGASEEELAAFVEIAEDTLEGRAAILGRSAAAQALDDAMPYVEGDDWFHQASDGGQRASEVRPRRVEWLWHPHIPLGKITLVAGAPGQAKSLFTMWLAASVSNGTGLTDRMPGTAVILSAEDDPEDTIVPRLIAAGANLERCWIEPPGTLDADRLADLCRREDVRLITVDPITAYLPGTVNSWKAQDVRAALEPLRLLAAEHRLAVVLVQHLNRRNDSDPLARIADSQGIAQLARSVMVWGPDPADPEGDHGGRKALTRAKGNLSRHSDSATFTIVEQDVGNGVKAPALTRGQDRAVDAFDVISDAETRTAQEEATDFLAAALAGGPRPSKHVQAEAREAGISDRTLRRAKAKLRVKATQHREGDKVANWIWELPNTSYTYGHLGHVGHVGHVDPDLGGQGGQHGLHGRDKTQATKGVRCPDCQRLLVAHRDTAQPYCPACTRKATTEERVA